MSEQAYAVIAGRKRTRGGIGINIDAKVCIVYVYKKIYKVMST